jgi:hypothetical protein
LDLQGSLKQHSVPELLSFAIKHYNSGILTISNRHERVLVSLSNGRLVQIVRDPLPKQGNFGQMMVDIGQIKPHQLEQALIQQRRSLSPLGEILSKLFSCSKQQIRSVLKVQLLERLYALLLWKTGDYKFEPKHVEIAARDIEPIMLEPFLREATAVINAWLIVKKHFYSHNLEINATDKEVPNNLQLNPTETKLLEMLMTRKHNFREISILGGLGEYTTAYVLYNLLTQQLISLNMPKTQLDIAKLLLGSKPSEFVIWLIMSFVLIGISTYLLMFATYSPLYFARSSARHHISTLGWSELTEKWREERIITALKLYHLIHNTYPNDLMQLVKERWLNPSELKTNLNQHYIYKRISNDRYRLLKPLP